MSTEILDPSKLSLRALVDLANTTKDLPEEMADLADYARDLLAGKLDRVAIMVKEVIPSHIEACKKQIENLKILEERLKAYTMECIELSGQTEINGVAYRARIQNNPVKVVVIDESKIPKEYFKERVTVELDKGRIKSDLLSGHVILGAELEIGQHVRFEAGRAKAKKL